MSKEWTRLAEADPERDDWHTPSAAALDEAGALRKQIATRCPPDPDRMLYVAGCAPATPVDLTIEIGLGELEVRHASS